MKTTLKLVIEDLDPDLGAPLVALFQRVAGSPRQKPFVFTRDAKPRFGARPRFGYDWRDVACRYLRRYLPKNGQCWIYRGGRHIAIHASPPHGGRQWMQGGEAGKCLARICERTHSLSK